MKQLFIDNTDLTRGKRNTFLSEDVVSTASTIRVQSIIGFESVTTSSGQILCIGEIGGERSELVRTSNSSGYAPSNSYKEVTLRDTLTQDHPTDTPVYIVDYNRIDIQWASSVSGTKATVIASPSYPIYIDPTQTETVFKDTTQSNGFYFTRFNETVGNTNSDFSDAIPYSGYDANMVFSIKQGALDDLGEQVDGVAITHEFLNESLWQARREYHQSPGKRPFRRRFNVDIGNVLTGSFRIELPTDVEKPHTAENVYGVRIGTQPNMRYYDKKDWDFDYIGKPRSFLTTAYATGDQDLYVSNVRDFADSGSVTVEGVTISYSAKSNTGGTMRISTAGSTSASVGSDVWQNVSYGLPDRFTVFAEPGGSAYIYFNRPFDSAYLGQNIYADYYRTLVGYDSDADSLDEPKYDMFKDYLKAKVKQRRSKGALDLTTDADHKLWLFKKKEALDSELLETEIRISPDVSEFNIPQ